MKSSLARPAASHAKKNVNIAAWLEVPSEKMMMTASRLHPTQ